ncbi:MAG: DNA polymerase III subunit alpha, partial [Saprospiraceae bacterium]|nr:DNA polymerase III subunit alpha [Saprospiraceae bacterium]
MYLNTHSCYSFKYGLLSIEDLVSKASRFGIAHLALTDINNTSGHWEFVDLCRKYDITPSLGIEFRLDQEFYYLGLATSPDGMSNLNALLSEYLVSGNALPKRAPLLADTIIIYDSACYKPGQLRENEYLGVRPGSLPHWHKYSRKLMSDKAVALPSVTLASVADLNTHKLLRAIHQNTILAKLAPSSICSHEDIMHPPEGLRQIYHVYPELLLAAQDLLERSACRWSLEGTNKKCYGKSLSADRVRLKELAYDGMRSRYQFDQDVARERIDAELQLIARLQFETYYLITWDLVRFASIRGYHHVGRGSGANSVVAYCLGITDVDPVSLNLYFERFINPHRPVPPDFDLDFSWDERDEVISYAREKYGRSYVGLLASFQTFKGKSTVRELGKVFGLSRKEIDLIVERPNARKDHHPLAEVIFREGRRILGLPSHLSMHPGAIVISEKTLNTIAASQMMPKGFPVVQLDKYQIEKWGLHKFDILGQRGIGHVKEAVSIIKQEKNIDVDIHDMQSVIRDPKALALLSKPGACIGCFYIESPAMRGLLAKVQCKTYLDLIAVSSIIRPGVAKSGMMKAFIERFHNPAKINVLHPLMSSLLSDTYGIMVYQEDVMKVVHHIGGFDLFQADLLRRLMTGKRKSERDLHELKERFITNCLANGMLPSLAKEIWRQISSFSGYAFCKAHSATYAAESMQSAYLKANFPVEFMVAVINNQGGFYPTWVYVRELQKTGVKVELPCINRSSWFTTLDGDQVFLGLNMIKGLSQSSGNAILELRKYGQPVTDLAALIAEIPQKQLELLIDIGACRTIDQNKESLSLRNLLRTSIPGPRQLRLFGQSQYQHLVDPPGSIQDQQFLTELSLLGFTLASPFNLLRSWPLNTIKQREMTNHGGETVRMLGLYV